MKLSGEKKDSSFTPWGEADFMATEDQDLAATSSYNWDQQAPDSSDFFSSVLQEECQVIEFILIGLKLLKPMLLNFNFFHF